MPSHRTQVLTTSSGKSVAICTCGFAGTDRNDLKEARGDAADHIVEFLRARDVKIVRTGKPGQPNS